MSAWTDFVTRWKDCQKCPLCRQRDRICLARGDIPCDVLFIGEAPGQVEDGSGLVFSGPAGRLLDNDDVNYPGIIQRALSSHKEWCAARKSDRWVVDCVTYALCNLVCCYPAEAKARGDNEPEKDEILACRPRLIEFVNIAQPRLIVLVGSLANQYVDNHDTVECIHITHPAAMLKMKAAQKQEAVRHATVILKCAVQKMLESERQPFAKWGGNYASFTEARGLRQRYDAWMRSQDDIPF